MPICQKFLTAIFIFLLVSPFSSGTIRAAVSIEITEAPTETQLGEEFQISFSASGLVSNASYYIKSRIGKTSSEMNQGETFNESTSSWLGDGSAWMSFPTMTAGPDGNLSADVGSRAKTSAELGSNSLTIRLHQIETGDYNDSSPITIDLLAIPTSEPTPTPTASLPTATPLATATPTPKAIYKINEVKDEDGGIISSAWIYVDDVYVHHYAPEILTFCTGCHCDEDKNVDCEFGEHVIKLEKNGYQDWEETETINPGGSYEANPVMETQEETPTATPTPTFTPTPTPTLRSATSTPTPKPTLKPTATATVSGEILGQESSPAAFYPWQATEGAEPVLGDSSSAPNRLLPAILLGAGFILLFSAAFWLWYTQLRNEN